MTSQILNGVNNVGIGDEKIHRMFLTYCAAFVTTCESRTLCLVWRVTVLDDLRGYC